MIYRSFIEIYVTFPEFSKSFVKSFEIKNMRLRRDDTFEDEGNRDKLFTFMRVVSFFYY